MSRRCIFLTVAACATVAACLDFGMRDIFWRYGCGCSVVVDVAVGMCRRSI
jgi:hypothetical protein